MSVHIGSIIRRRLEEKGMTKTEFARRINTTSQNIYGIFKRKTLDTALLSKISGVLEYNFFQYFYPEEMAMVKEPSLKYGAGKKQPVTAYPTVNELSRELERCKKELTDATKEIEYLKKIIALMEKK